MSTSWLANADSATAWAHRSWEEIGAMPGKERVVTILPIHGFADHGLGLPLDAEEVAGSAILTQSSQFARETIPFLIMPPLRFNLAPYPSAFFGIDAETAHDQVREIARSVQDAGFRKLVFFVTSPWNVELIDAASRDVRADLGLQTFVINLSGLALDFHPASDRRTHVQAVVSHVLGKAPEAAMRAAEITDANFRPGNFRQPSPLAPDASLDGARLLIDAAQRFARLLSEIHARAPLEKSAQPRTDAPKIPPPAIAPAPASDGVIFPSGYRAHYLPGLTRDALENLPDKDRTLVILPTGAIEQHGHHLPLGVDSILGQSWLAHSLPKLPAAARVAIAPPIMVGKSNEHTGFPGTLTVSAKTLRRLLLAAAAQVHALGFRHLAVLNTHGGNSAVLVYTLREIQTSLGLRAGFVNIPFKPDLPPQEAEYGFHAGEWETSLMLACAPELVRMGKAVCEYPARLDDPGELRPENAPATLSWLSSDISQSGVMGDATQASREKGLRWLDAGSTALARRIAELLPP